LQTKPAINLENNKRPQVLLIDEVDVFFSDSFFGNVYIPTAEIKNDAVSALCDYIWAERQKKIEELSLMSEED
jgi:fatty acid/phospholipid biosynthesis enzyme